MKPARICIVPEFPLSLMTGGTLVQATETCRAMNRWTSPDVMQFEMFEWSRAGEPADCYHFIGLPKYLAGLCSLIAQSKRPYLLTLLMGAEHDAGLRAAAWRRRVGTWLGRSRDHQRAIERASAIISINSIDAKAISAIYSVSLERVQQVPVAVSEPYFEARPELWTSQYGAAPFVLCVGAVQERKNQLLLARTCNELRLPLVLVGTVLHGQNDYASAVRHAMSENEKLGGRWLRCDDAMLASAYAACRAFALLSSNETQPASVLQGMALRKPILLGDAPYAREYPFAGLVRADWRDAGRVAAALCKLWAEPVPSSLPDEFTWPKVCQKLGAIYSTVLAQ